MADNTETIATVAMQSSKAWPAVFHQGAALCLWRAAVAAIEAAGFSIVQNADLAAARAENERLRANTGAERTRKIAAVIASAAIAAGVDPADVRGRSRLQGPARARHVAVWLLSEAGWTRPQIGRAFGRDHTTALNSTRRVDAALAGRTFGDEARIVDVARDVLAAMAARIARKDGGRNER